MFWARFANGDVTAPGLRPARAAVRCLLPGIKIAEMLLVPRAACAKQGTAAAPRGGSVQDKPWPRAPRRLFHPDVLGGANSWMGTYGAPQYHWWHNPCYFIFFCGELREFHENSLYFCCAFGLTLSEPITHLTRFV